MTLFRDELLHGRSVALAGGVPSAIGDLLSELGARLETLEDQDAQAWAGARCPIDALVYDAVTAFGAGGEAGLRAAVDRAGGGDQRK